jgi:hypothetical protein
MFYILIVMSTLSGTTSGVNVTTQEFTTLKKCQEAAKIISTDTSKKQPTTRKNITTFCIEK